MTVVFGKINTYVSDNTRKQRLVLVRSTEVRINTLKQILNASRFISFA